MTIRKSFFIFILMISCNLYASESQNASASDTVLRVGIVSSSPSARLPNGTSIGVIANGYRDVINHIDPDIQFEFVSASIERLRYELLSGNIDLLFSPSTNELMQNAKTVFMPKGHPIELWSLPDKPVHPDSDMENVSLGVYQAYQDHSFLEGMDSVVVPSTERLATMLISGRVDAILALGYVVQYHLKMHGRNPDQFIRHTIDHQSFVLWTHYNSVIDKDIEQWEKAAAVVLSPQRNEQRWVKFLDAQSNN